MRRDAKRILGSLAIGAVLGLVVSIVMLEKMKMWFASGLSIGLVLLAPGVLVEQLGLKSANAYVALFDLVNVLYYATIVHAIRLVIGRISGKRRDMDE